MDSVEKPQFVHWRKSLTPTATHTDDYIIISTRCSDAVVCVHTLTAPDLTLIVPELLSSYLHSQRKQ